MYLTPLVIPLVIPANTRNIWITDAPTQAASKALLQEIYERIPFLEMKRSDYDYYVEAP